MGNRRGKGEGSIRERADGRWEGRIDLGRGVDGKRRAKSVFGVTQAATVLAMKRLNGRAAGGQVLSTTTPTVKTFLADWMATGMTVKGNPWRPSTKRSYQSAVDLYLVPAFGNRRLEQLTPLLIQRWLTDHKNLHGARRRVELAHAILRSALAEARRLEIVGANAAERVKVARPIKRAIVTLTVEQSRVFLTVVHAHRLGALFSVALASGVRLGEATGLLWEHVDLETGEVRIRQQLQRVGKTLVLQPLKTEKSRRTLMLPAVCLEQLRKHRQRQLEERLKAGARWVDTGLVFTTYTNRGPGKRVGAPIHPRNVLRMLHMLLERADLPRLRFHELRHSAASLLIAAGVELVEISMLLGHSELRVTADLYSHLQKQTAATAARHMENVLRG
jgi:integrase